MFVFEKLISFCYGTTNTVWCVDVELMHCGFPSLSLCLLMETAMPYADWLLFYLCLWMVCGLVMDLNSISRTPEYYVMPIAGSVLIRLAGLSFVNLVTSWIFFWSDLIPKINNFSDHYVTMKGKINSYVRLQIFFCGGVCFSFPGLYFLAVFFFKSSRFLLWSRVSYIYFFF